MVAPPQGKERENESALSITEVRDSLISLIKQADRAGANALLDAWAARHGYEPIFKQLLEPALVVIGEAISGETHTLAQAYVATKVAEDTLNKAIQQAGDRSEDQPRGQIVLGNAEGDFHGLGRRMVATMLRANGWTVHDLGNDVTASEFVDKALETGTRVIGVSAMTMSTALGVRQVRQEIDARGLTGRVQLAVGGAVFLSVPSLHEEVGGDGTSSSMFDAPILIERLWNQSIQWENAR